MELELEKTTLLLLPTTLNNNTLALLPTAAEKSAAANLASGISGALNTLTGRRTSSNAGIGDGSAAPVQLHRLAIGDTAGAVTLYETKRGVLTKSASHVVQNESGSSNGITCLTLGGASPLNPDKLFLSTATSVHALNRKLKPFFSLTSNLSEPFTRISVCGGYLFTAGEYAVQTFSDGVEIPSHQCLMPDVVNGMDWVPLPRADGGGGGPTGSSSDQNAPEYGWGPAAFERILGCQDRCVRVLRGTGTDGEKVQPPTVFSTSARVSALGVYDKFSFAGRVASSGGVRSKAVYGCSDGTVGMVSILSSLSPNPTPDAPLHRISQSWSQGPSAVSGGGSSSLASSGAAPHRAGAPVSTPLGPVTSLAFFDLTRSGSPNILAGHASGHVQVLSFDSSPDRPQKVFEAALPECVASIGAGRVSREEYEEVVVCGFGGTVTSFTTEPLSATAGRAMPDGKPEERNAGGKSSKSGSSKTTLSLLNESKLKQMQKEVEEMEAQLADAKKKTVQAVAATAKAAGSAAASSSSALADPRTTKNDGGINNNNSSASLADSGGGGGGMAVQQLSCRHSFALDEVSAAYILDVDVPSPLNLVLLASSVNVDLLDCDGNTATVTSSPPDLQPPDSKGSNAAPLKVCACYRMVEQSNRLRMKIRTTEGEVGTIKVTVVAGAPSGGGKIAVVVQLPVKPLSLHTKAVFTEEEAGRVLNTLTLKGGFGMTVAHDWIKSCLPEVPPFQDDGEPSKNLTFRNVFTNSLVNITYGKDKMLVRSDNLSTLAIFKEHVSREATSRRISLSDSVEVKEETIPGFLGLLHERLQRLLSLTRQVEILEALKEINSAENDGAAWLSEEYKEVLANADKIKSEHKSRPQMLQYLCGLITDLFVDRHRLRGIDVRHHIPQLQGLITDYDFDRLLSVFSNNFDA